jgi:hypothetical protein
MENCKVILLVSCRVTGACSTGLSECVMRVTGVLGAQLYRLLAPRQDTGTVASERGALDANLDIRGWTPRRRRKFHSEGLRNLRACFGVGLRDRVGKTSYSEGPTFKSRLEDRLLVIFLSFHRNPGLMTYLATDGSFHILWNILFVNNFTI